MFWRGDNWACTCCRGARSLSAADSADPATGLTPFPLASASSLATRASIPRRCLNSWFSTTRPWVFSRKSWFSSKSFWFWKKVHKRLLKQLFQLRIYLIQYNWSPLLLELLENSMLVVFTVGFRKLGHNYGKASYLISATSWGQE